MSPEHEIELYDLESIRQLVECSGQQPFGPDNLHLTKEFYAKIESEFPFDAMLKSVIKRRLASFLDSNLSDDLLPIEAAKKELTSILSSSFTQKDETDMFVSHLMALKDLCNAASPELKSSFTESLEKVLKSIQVSQVANSQQCLEKSIAVLNGGHSSAIFAVKKENERSVDSCFSKAKKEEKPFLI